MSDSPMERNPAPMPLTGIIVVNARTIPWATPTIYIGRAVRGRKASPLGNPFKIKDESERAGAIEKYRAWLEEQMRSDTPARREIHRIAEFAAGLAKDTPLGLVCWCAPALCHGDVVKKFVEAAMKGGDQETE